MLRIRKTHVYILLGGLTLLSLLAWPRIASANDEPPPPDPCGGINCNVVGDEIDAGGECDKGCNLLPPTSGSGDEEGEDGENEGSSEDGSDSGLLPIGDDEFIISGEPWCSPTGGDMQAQAEAGVGGIGEDGGCTWTCGDDSIAWYQGLDGGLYAEIETGNDPDSGFDNFQGTDEATGSTSIPSGTSAETVENYIGAYTCSEWDTTGSPRSDRDRVEEICWWQLEFNLTGDGGGGSGGGGGGGGGRGGGTFSCGGNYDVRASASIPCPAVIRNPYPLGLVGTPMQFTVSANGSSSSDSSRNWCEIDIRDYAIEVGWVQVPITPIWDWDERSWGNPKQSQGWTTYHTYETASYQLDHIGPGHEGRLDQPAYLVNVHTWWQPYVKESWLQWEVTNFHCEEDDVLCQQRQDFCRGVDQIDSSDCGDWEERSSGRIMIDLRWFGFPEPYARRTTARDATPMPPEWPEINPDTRGCTIPVPMLELQSLLADP